MSFQPLTFDPHAAVAQADEQSRAVGADSVVGRRLAGLVSNSTSGPLGANPQQAISARRRPLQ